MGGCQAMSDGKDKVNLELLTWPETPHTLESMLPAVCEKNVFCLFRPSAGGKPHLICDDWLLYFLGYKAHLLIRHSLNFLTYLYQVYKLKITPKYSIIRRNVNKRIFLSHSPLLQQHTSHSGLNFFFFGLKFHNCSSCVYNCDDQPKIHIFLHSSNIWSFIYSFTTSKFANYGLFTFA